MSYLLDFYGEAIPQKHREIMSQYYEEDLSLAEIAENFDMSRQGARHLIKKGEEQLLFLEEKLGLAQKHKDMLSDYEDFFEKMQRLREELACASEKEKMLELFNEALEASKKLKLD